jgi:hypothetical protein
VDVRPDISPQAVDELNRRLCRTGLSAWLMKWTFLHFLARIAHSRAELNAMIHRTGFSRQEIREDSLGYEVWLWKD